MIADAGGLGHDKLRTVREGRLLFVVIGCDPPLKVLGKQGFGSVL